MHAHGHQKIEEETTLFKCVEVWTRKIDLIDPIQLKLLLTSKSSK